jgi:PAS domain-containing protein
VPDGDSDNQGDSGNETVAPEAVTPKTVTPEAVDLAASLPLAIRELLDADRTAAIVLALDGTVLSANETALELFGAKSVATMTPGSASHG